MYSTNSLSVALNQPWIDITELFNESRSTLQPGELLRCAHFHSAVSMSAVVLGCPSNDGGHPASERMTLRRVQEQFGVQPVQLESRITKTQNRLINEDVLEITDGLLIKAVEFLCGFAPRSSNLGTCVFLHNNAALLVKSCPVLRLYVDCILLLCELASRIQALFLTFFSGENEDFRYSSQLVWNLRLRAYGAAAANKLTWEYFDPHMGPVQWKSFEINVREQDHIRLLPTLSSRDGQLPSAQEMLGLLNEWTTLNPSEDLHPVRCRLLLCRDILLAVAPLETLTQWSDAVLCRTVHALLDATQRLPEILTSSPFATSKKRTSLASMPKSSRTRPSPGLGDSQPTGHAIRRNCALTNIPGSRFFHHSLIGYLAVTCPKPVARPTSFHDAMKLLREFILKVILLLLSARASTARPSLGHTLYDAILQRCTGYCSVPSNTSTTIPVRVWSPLGSALCSVAFLFRTFIFPLSHLLSVTDNHAQDPENIREKTLQCLSNVIWGPIIDPQGREVVHSRWELETQLNDATLYCLRHEIREVVVSPGVSARVETKRDAPGESVSKSFPCDDDTITQDSSHFSATAFFSSCATAEFSSWCDSVGTSHSHTPLVSLVQLLVGSVFSRSAAVCLIRIPSATVLQLGQFVSKHFEADHLENVARWMKLVHAPTGTRSEAVQEILTLWKTQPSFSDNSEASDKELRVLQTFTTYYHLQRVRHHFVDVMLVTADLFSNWTYPLVFYVAGVLCLEEAMVERDLLHCRLEMDNPSQPVPIPSQNASQRHPHPLVCLGSLFHFVQRFLLLGYTLGYNSPPTPEQRLSEATLWEINLKSIIQPLMLPWGDVTSLQFPATTLQDLPPYRGSSETSESQQLYTTFVQYRRSTTGINSYGETLYSTAHEDSDNTTTPDNISVATHAAHSLRTQLVNFVQSLSATDINDTTFLDTAGSLDQYRLLMHTIRSASRALLYTLSHLLVTKERSEQSDSSSTLKAHVTWVSVWNVPIVTLGMPSGKLSCYK